MISVSHSSSAIEAFLKARLLNPSPEADVEAVMLGTFVSTEGAADCTQVMRQMQV